MPYLLGFFLFPTGNRLKAQDVITLWVKWRIIESLIDRGTHHQRGWPEAPTAREEPCSWLTDWYTPICNKYNSQKRKKSQRNTSDRWRVWRLTDDITMLGNLQSNCMKLDSRSVTSNICFSQTGFVLRSSNPSALLQLSVFLINTQGSPEHLYKMHQALDKLQSKPVYVNFRSLLQWFTWHWGVTHRTFGFTNSWLV